MIMLCWLSEISPTTSSHGPKKIHHTGSPVIFKFSGQRHHIIGVVAEHIPWFWYPPRRASQIQNTNHKFFLKFNYKETILLKALIVHEHQETISYAPMYEVGIHNLIAAGQQSFTSAAKPGLVDTRPCVHEMPYMLTMFHKFAHWLCTNGWGSSKELQVNEHRESCPWNGIILYLLGMTSAKAKSWNGGPAMKRNVKLDAVM